MTQAHHDLFARANPRRDQVVGVSDQVVGFDEELRAECMALWPKKTAVHLAIAADVTVRQAERILGRKQGFSLTVFTRLLRSDHGERFLRAQMRGCRAPWWQEVGQERQITALKKQRRALEKQLKDIEGEIA